jgi:hypothetical protein
MRGTISSNSCTTGSHCGFKYRVHNKQGHAGRVKAVLRKRRLCFLKQASKGLAPLLEESALYSSAGGAARRTVCEPQGLVVKTHQVTRSRQLVLLPPQLQAIHAVHKGEESN